MHFAPHASSGTVPARVAVQHRDRYIVYDGLGEHAAVLAGSMRHAQREPAVGDWVVLTAPDAPVIVDALPRRTAFVRKAAGSDTPQVVAANVDVLFLVTAAVGDFNLRRLERYVIAARASGAMPVVVVTKADLHDEPTRFIADVRAIGSDVAAHAISSLRGEGLDALDPYFAGHRTVALVGSSGVGKSTLANRLLGRDHFATNAIIATGRGQHTTTHRELCIRPSGGLLLDTPGMREFGLWGIDSLDDGFADVASFASRCRFRDCVHDGEPGCAVHAALKRGDLDHARWDAYRKLSAETAALATRTDPRLAAAHRKQLKVRARAHRVRDRED